jgi:hypothetical protein
VPELKILLTKPYLDEADIAAAEARERPSRSEDSRACLLSLTRLLRPVGMPSSSNCSESVKVSR